jgi:serine phosphatase RsbU (regulator of sigma subunit)
MIIEKLVDAGDNWMNGRAQDDDITFVVIRIK